MKKFQDILIRYQGAVSFVLVMLLLGVVAGYSANANAQQELPEGLEGKHIEIPVICGDTRDLYRALTEDHGEVPVVIGFSKKEVAVVWFTDPNKETMTFVIDTPQGESCMLYSTRCFEGDCYMTPGEVQERSEDVVIDSPKVSM
tara:strand:- start:3053 stop:3484 length:432 start_codon:yes stop_codon:yes gene_type:complete